MSDHRMEPAEGISGQYLFLAQRVTLRDRWRDNGTA
jgi:hypothetical protein